MEYRLNKIDTEIRERIRKITAAGKVHHRRKVESLKNSSEDKKFNLPQKKFKNKKILISAIKDRKVSIEVEAYRENSINEMAKGNFLDIRK